MPHSKEPPTKRRSRIRAHFPDEGWRKHVSSGAIYAHDEVLGGKGKRSRKIRARGYDRKRLSKSVKSEAPDLLRTHAKDIKLGPFSYSERRSTPFPMDKNERNIEYARAFFGSKLPVVLVAAGGGAGIATKLSEDTKKRAKKLIPGDKKEVGKSMDIYQILNKSYDPNEIDYYDLDDGLVLIDKGAITTGLKVGGGLALTGAAGYGLYRGAKFVGKRGLKSAQARWVGTEAGREELKRKARKYALYGGGGLAGSIAAGTAVGNAV